MGRGLAVPAAAPGNTATVIGVLIFAVGASQSVTTIWIAVVGQTLPYRHPDQVVVLSGMGLGATGLERLSDQEIALLHEESAVFAWIGHFQSVDVTMGEDSGRSVAIGVLAPGALEALGVRPIHGRGLFPEDHEGVRRSGSGAPGAPDIGKDVVLLAHNFWQSALGGSPDAIGSHLILNNRSMEVVGVMPAGFFAQNAAEAMWVPARRAEPQPGIRRYALTVARMRPGIAPAEASAGATAVLRGAGFRNDEERIRAVRLGDQLTATIRPTLELLMVGSLLLVGVAGISVVGLRLSRSGPERRAWNTRRALGASWTDEVVTTVFRILMVGAAVTVGSSLLSVWIVPALRGYGLDLAFVAGSRHRPGSTVLALAIAYAATALAEAPALLEAARHRRLSPGIATAAGWRKPLVSRSLTVGCAAATVILTATAVMGGSAWALLTGRGGYDDRRLDSCLGDASIALAPRLSDLSDRPARTPRRRGHRRFRAGVRRPFRDPPGPPLRRP